MTSADTGLEKHYSVQEVADGWGISEKTVRRMFEAEPGVLKISKPRSLTSSRARRVTLRIPASAVTRVHEYWSADLAPAVVAKGIRRSVK